MHRLLYLPGSYSTMFNQRVGQMIKVEFEELKNNVLKLLEQLDPHLSYHNIDHTLDVVQVCTEMATRESLSKNEAFELKAAALFHDVGFLRSFDDHEANSVSIAQEKLKEYKANEDSIQRISEMILATKVPQRPQNKIAKLLCDADLDYLGRDDFEKISNGLYLEMKYRGLVENQRSWDLIQVKFLESHQYFTEYSKAHREPQKQLNLKRVMQRI